MTPGDHLNSTPSFLLVKKQMIREVKYLPKVIQRVTSKIRIWTKIFRILLWFSLRARSSVRGVLHKPRRENHRSGSHQVSFPDKSVWTWGIHNPEVNLARLDCLRPSGDLGSGLTKLKCNGKRFEPRKSADVSQVLALPPPCPMNLARSLPLFEPQFPHLDSRLWQAWTII